MLSIAVTGASGAVGKRLSGLLIDRASAEESAVARIVAIDRRRSAPSLDAVEAYQMELMTGELAPALNGCSSIVHLAEDAARRSEPDAAAAVLDRMLTAASAAGVGHVVLLSSALVYGAHADNPVPLTEAHDVRPIPELTHAAVKVDLERQATRWAKDNGADLSVLRPTAILSDGDSSWIGAALRAATAVRPERVDAPVQFLHHDDLRRCASVCQHAGETGTAPGGPPSGDHTPARHVGPDGGR